MADIDVEYICDECGHDGCETRGIVIKCSRCQEKQKITYSDEYDTIVAYCPKCYEKQAQMESGAYDDDRQVMRQLCDGWKRYDTHCMVMNQRDGEKHPIRYIVEIKKRFGMYAVIDHHGYEIVIIHLPSGRATTIPFDTMDEAILAAAMLDQAGDKLLPDRPLTEKEETEYQWTYGKKMMVNAIIQKAKIHASACSALTHEGMKCAAYMHMEPLLRLAEL